MSKSVVYKVKLNIISITCSAKRTGSSSFVFQRFCSHIPALYNIVLGNASFFLLQGGNRPRKCGA